MAKKEKTTGEVFNMINGYTDKEGVFHTDFELVEMTGAEEEAIAKNDIKANGGKVVRTLLERCCVRIGTLEKSEIGETKWRGIIQDLPVAEQDIMLLRLREISLGKEIETQHKCPFCEKDMTTIIETDELEIIGFKGEDLIEFELPKGLVDKKGNIKKVGKIRLPKGEDREILDPIARKNIGKANTSLLTRCIVELEGERISASDIRDLSLKDREYLLDVLKENTYGVNLTVDIDCPECMESYTATLNMKNFL